MIPAGRFCAAALREAGFPQLAAVVDEGDDARARFEFGRLGRLLTPDEVAAARRARLLLAVARDEAGS